MVLSSPSRLIVVDSGAKRRGGREQYASDFVRYLSAHQPNVTVLSTDDCRRVPSPRGDPSTRVLAFSPTRDPTHYQLHGGLLSAAFAAERESFESSVRRALFGPALMLNGRRQHRLADEDHLLAGAAALMVFCERDRRELLRRGVTAERIRLARPGVDSRRFAPPTAPHVRPASDTTLRLAFVGHNFALKGLPAAIQAIAGLRRNGVEALLTVVGGRGIRSAARLADRHGVATHVHFVGGLSQDQMVEIYRHADALVHPTFYDPFPRVVIEALASGCPVVITARCGASEIVTHGREGFVIDDPRDVTSLTNALAALDDRRTRDAMRRHACALGRQFNDVAHFRAVCEWLFPPSAVC